MNDLKPLHKTIIACVFLVAIVFLQYQGQDTATVITVGLLLLGVAGYNLGRVEAVQKQTNGSQDRMIKVIEENTKQQIELIKLVASLPPAPPAAIESRENTGSKIVAEKT